MLVQSAAHKIASSVEDLGPWLNADVVDQVEREEVAGALVVEIYRLGESNGEVRQGHISSNGHRY